MNIHLLSFYLIYYVVKLFFSTYHSYFFHPTLHILMMFCCLAKSMAYNIPKSPISKNQYHRIVHLKINRSGKNKKSNPKMFKDSVLWCQVMLCCRDNA